MTRHPVREARTGSGLAVAAALTSNLLIGAGKLVAFLVTGSTALLSEVLHSAADANNQVLLAVGLRQSRRAADPNHPYGYSRSRWVWALISAAGVLFVGCGVSLVEGIRQVLAPEPLEALGVAWAVLGASFLLESVSLLLGLRAVLRGARSEGISAWRYLHHGADSMGVAVLLEDSAALVGLSLAAGAIGLTVLTGDPRWDGVGSIAIGVLLGGNAVFLINRNRVLLIERSVPLARRQHMIGVLTAEPTVRAVKDVKSTVMGPGHLKFKAEVDFDGRALARRHLEGLDLDALVEELGSREALEAFLLDYGEALVDGLGDEVDRLEAVLREAVPEMRHVDLEAD